MKTKKYLFQKLTPINNIDLTVYEEAIDFIFENSDVKNVAITGAYSAGKSSVIESYKAKHKNYNFMHISLAHFHSPDQENAESDELIKESILEGKILNQLIHQIPSEKIPQTNFRVKKGVCKGYLNKLTFLVCSFILSLTLLMSSSSISAFITDFPDNWVKIILSSLFNSYSIILISLVLFSCSIIFIYNLIKAQKNKNVFRKISLQGNEIEIFEEQNDSYFDKYLNEVLYLFENAEADVIVFEDMDRLNINRIFERLREVNTLVNIQRKKEKKDKYVPLRFMYLLRDDIFISKDRTKFFDYIIPIVPVIDSSNSYEQFLKHLKDGKLLEKFDQAFLQSLSLYVDDMRILKNIYNEFVIYMNRLNTTELDCNKMMAIITYKNIFPRDFSDLQLARGFIYTLFKQKPVLIDEAIITAEENKKSIFDRMESMKKETLISQQELTDAYNAKIERLPQERYSHNLTPQGQQLKKLYDEELSKRKQAVQDILDSNLPMLETQLSNVEQDILLIRTKSLKALITRENIDSIFSINYTNEVGEINKFEEIKGSEYFDLLKFLVRNGYIDETYTDYMTYFYEDSISANDKIFLRHITDKRGFDYTYALKEPNKIIESPVIRTVEFQQEETLNFNLFECLLLNESIEKYRQCLKVLFNQIKDTRNFDFLSKFFDLEIAHKQLIIKTNELWSEFLSLALSGKELPSEQIRKYSIYTFYFSDEAIIKEININDCLSKYVSNCADYLNIDNPQIEKLISGFKLIGVYFVKIDYDISNKRLFDEIYNHSLYALTFDNIRLMLIKEYGIENEQDIFHKNYTLVQNQIRSPLSNYISENISLYIKTILDKCNGDIFDDADIAICLLNNEDVNEIEKKRYIEYLSTKIDDITQINDKKLWTPMIDKQIISFSVNNFMSYYMEYELNELLVSFVNNEISEIDFTMIVEDYENTIVEKLFNDIAICNQLNSKKYSNILSDLGYFFNNYDADEINGEKFEILIVEGILKMNADSLEFVRDKYSRYLRIFIKQNLNEYCSIQKESLYRINEVLDIITWDIEDNMKLDLLTFNKQPISVVGKNYTDSVNAYIILNCLDANDKRSLYIDYSRYKNETQDAIAEIAAMNVNEIIVNNMAIDDVLMSILLQGDSIIREQKIKLFISAIPMLNEETCKTHFDELGFYDLKAIFLKNKGRRNYEKNQEVKTILDALKNHGWIYDYHVDERNSERYIIIKNKPRKN